MPRSTTPSAWEVSAPSELDAFTVGALSPDLCDREDPRVDVDAAFVEGSPAVDGESTPGDPESGGAAEQMAGVVVTAAPTPRVTASVPILPMCLT
jgi:hypothetical protein